MTLTRAALVRLTRLWLVVAVATPLDAAEIQPRALLGTRAEAATLIVQGIESGSLPLAAVSLAAEVKTVEAPDGSATLRMPILFEVPGVGLPEEVATAPALEFYAYALTPAGSVAAHLGLAVDLEPGQLPAWSGIKLLATLDLPPGTYSLRFLVLEPESHRFGLRSERLSLPAADEPPVLTRPAVGDSCDDWRVAATAGAAIPTVAARPVLVTGGTVEITSRVVGTRSGGAAGDVSGTVDLTPTSAEATETHALLAESLGEHRFAFVLPPIARGVYRLSVRLARPTGDLISPSTEVWVVDTEDLGPVAAGSCSRTWSAVIAHASGLSQPGGGPAGSAGARLDASQPEKRAQRTRLRRAYREVLERLAVTSDIGAAARALCEVEQRQTTVGAGLQSLLRNQLEVARRLATDDTEILPPLMMLHHQAYLDHLRLEQFALAGHSGRVVRALAELMLDRDPPAESLAVASGILTSLAEHGHRNRMLTPSQLALEDALDMNPVNQDALLLLAVNYEWLGRYEESARLLERLVEVAATHSEARLRLAIMRQRTGETVEAERHLERLLRERASSWILSLAYQTLAGLLREQERHAEAVELLRRGRARLGSDQRLHVLSAHALDRVGRPAEAHRLLLDLPIDDNDRTPRFRYGESLTSPLVSLRRSVDRGVAVRLPRLAAVRERAE